MEFKISSGFGDDLASGQSDGINRPLVFGEVLFDHFPDQKVLGGAPFNVAWNLAGLGLNPLMVTRIGDDREGASIRKRMEKWGMDPSALQISSDQPTGRVEVSIHDGQPTYDIVTQQAYDFIERPSALENAHEFTLLYHGSLAWRSERNRTTLRELISTTKLPRFVDINIRKPHFEVQWLGDLLPGAKWIKVNDEELGLLANMSVKTQQDIAIGVAKLIQRYGAAVYFVTAGAKGAYLVDGNEVVFAAAPKPRILRDTVGAGDAFAAMAIEGIIRGRTKSLAMERAVAFAAKVCGISGATLDDESLYAGNSL